jgi:hypothetical protein
MLLVDATYGYVLQWIQLAAEGRDWARARAAEPQYAGAVYENTRPSAIILRHNTTVNITTKPVSGRS